MEMGVLEYGTAEFPEELYAYLERAEIEEKCHEL